MFNLFLFTIFFVNLNSMNSQTLTLSVYTDQYPTNCTSAQYFDTVLMTCQSCPQYTSSNLNDRKFMLFI